MKLRAVVGAIMSHPISKTGLKLSGFLAAGLPSFAIAVPLNWFLVEKLSLAEPVAYALVLLFQVTLNFFMCRWLVFKDRKQTLMWVQFYQFVAGILFFRIADWALYTIVVHYTAIYYLFVQLANVFIFAVLKFKFSQKVMER
jgi:putative flippase GtrA